MTEIVRDERLRDFRAFLYLVWMAVLKKPPTALQYDIARTVAGDDERLIVEGFRGVAKSWITAAYVTYNLYWNPDFKALIVSASQAHTDDISTFILQQIELIPELAFLSPKDRERSSKRSFDVGPAAPDKQPSVRALGVTGQLTGNRADLVIGDDIETSANSLTQEARAKLAASVREFDAILKPGGKIRFLGTPQTEQSIYNGLAEKGYTIRIWPARYPDQRLLSVHGARLSPSLLEAMRADPSLEGKSTEPSRFSDADLAAREASWGRSGFALQFLLDTSLSDENRYPLKLRDLLVFDVLPTGAPETLVWSSSPERERKDLPNVGFQGDRLLSPLVPAEAKYAPYQATAMAVDPSGRGKDETGVAVGRMLNGFVHVPVCTGLAGGYTDSNLERIARWAKEHSVNRVVIESNFGDGMFAKLLQPVLARIHPCTIEEVRSSIQKEKRIIDTLEPVLNQHRLVIDPRVILEDSWRSGEVDPDRARSYMLAFQLTRLTKDRGSLLHDDRLDALAILCAHFAAAMAHDSARDMSAARQAELEKELEEFCRQDDLRWRQSGPPRWSARNAGLARGGMNTNTGRR